MKNVTIADVAHAAGVSVTTVSRYLNGNYKKMSEKTKLNLEKTIAQLHYMPKNSARRMRQNKSHVVGVIVADISNVFSSRLFKGIYDILQPAGYDVLLMNSNNTISEETSELRRLFAQQVDGVIIQPNSRTFSQYQLLEDSSLPYVLVDRKPSQQPTMVTSVRSSNFDATYQLGAHLMDRGYTRVVSFSRTLAEISAQSSRVAGLHAFSQTHALSYINIETANLTLPDLQEIFHKNFYKGNEKTAVLSLMGPLLFDLLQVLKQEELVFPKDLGLISFDDWSWSQYVNDGIYLLQQQPDLMGKIAAQQLLIQINKQSIKGSTHFVPVRTIQKPSI